MSLEGARERFRLESVSIVRRRHLTRGVSELPVDGCGHDRGESECRKLLAMHEVRRRVERVALAANPVRIESMAMTRPE